MDSTNQVFFLRFIPGTISDVNLSNLAIALEKSIDERILANAHSWGVSNLQ